MKRFFSLILLVTLVISLVSCACDKIDNRPLPGTTANTVSTDNPDSKSTASTNAAAPKTDVPPTTDEKPPVSSTEAKDKTDAPATTEAPVIVEPDKTELTENAVALVGEWKYDRNMASVLNDQLVNTEADTDLSIVKTDSFIVTYVLSLNSDKTASLKIDRTSVEKALDSYIVLMKEKLTTYMTRKFNETLKKYNITDMTPDQLLASQNSEYTTVKDWCSATIDETVDKKAIVDSFMAETNGYFNANDSRIFFYSEEYSEDRYAEYSLSGNTLTLKSVSESYSKEWGELLPATLSK